jgi:type IV pilus assembly protein PilE
MGAATSGRPAQTSGLLLDRGAHDTAQMLALAPIRPSRLPRGFTLIELMIAVAIVAILIALAFPSYRDSVHKGRRADAMTAFASIQQAQERRRSNNPAYADNLSQLVGSFPSGLYTMSLAAPDSGTLNAGYIIVADATGAQTSDRTCKRMSVRVINGNVSYGACESCTTFTYAVSNPCFKR